MEETWSFLKSNKHWSRSLNSLWKNLPAPYRMIQCLLLFLFALCKKSYLSQMTLKKRLVAVFWFWLVATSMRAYHVIEGFPTPQLVTACRQSRQEHLSLLPAGLRCPGGTAGYAGQEQPGCWSRCHRALATSQVQLPWSYRTVDRRGSSLLHSLMTLRSICIVCDL